MATAGYYRSPTIHSDTIVFVCEDDLWSVPAAGGIARRLTSNLGEVHAPSLSGDGRSLAFTGREEGHDEVYVMPALGGPARRLTYLGGDARVVGWTPDGQEVVFASSHAQPFDRRPFLYAIPAAGGEPRLLPTGPAVHVSFGPVAGMVIGRNAVDLARWKRYRGGTAGELWIDGDGSGQWQRLVTAAGLGGNVALPLWFNDRIYFLSDHEGIGNLYSLPLPPDAAALLPPALKARGRVKGRRVGLAGDDLRRHTEHEAYYVREIDTDGRRIVYSAGAELYVYNPATGTSRMVDVQLHSPRVQRNRKFVDASRYLQGYDLHPEGYAVALTSRGQAFSMANWEGAVSQHGQAVPDSAGEEAADGDNAAPVAVRQRLATWLHDGKRLVTVNDAEGEEALEVFAVDGGEPSKRLAGLDIGRPVILLASPKRDQVALANHRNELVLVDLEQGSARQLDRSLYERLHGLAWSPDGHWLAYGFFNSQQTSIIKLANVDTGDTVEVTRPVLRDEQPAWDPEGKYLYFLSARDFDPVYDSLQFDLNFPRGARPYLVTLRKDLLSPFIPQPQPPDEKTGQKEDGEGKAEAKVEAEAERHKLEAAEKEEQGQAEAEVEKKQEGDEPIRIDLEGIADRIVAFPVDDARYRQIRGIRGKALFSWWPIEGSLGESWRGDPAPKARGVLDMYDFAEQKCETLVDGITNFDLSMDAKTLIYRAGNRLRVLKAGSKPEDHDASANRRTGWLDLERVQVSVLPGAEWAQMYRHGWRLQRDHFWTEDMSGVDWQQVFQRYWPLVARVATRSEFSDLMWEMQGELGTSHAYEFGGDYRPEPDYYQGFLGADLAYDEAAGGYRITHIVRGDPWNEKADSPLREPGLNIAEGDVLLAVAGRRLSRELPPQQALVNQAGKEILLVLAGRNGDRPRTATVKTLRSERAARYREWVEANRRRVHEATGGRVGYIHIPDMGPRGYAEFHRSFLAEVVYDALIVDVRYNGGGHVSQLLLEKLARRLIGYDVQRWGQPEPFPAYAIPGPMVALTDENAGSDGDIFSHSFKLMKLGPLIGKRTWGGVVGINPKEALLDGGVTTQPEYSFWFADVGWGVENYGTDPDIEVEIAPQDWVAGRDPQMDRALAEVTRLLEENPPKRPDFGNRPRRSLPALPS